MKKSIKTLILVLIMISFATLSMAANVSVSLKANKEKVEVGDKVTIAVKVNNFTREGEQKAIEAKLEYDTSKLEYESKGKANDWSVTLSSDKTGLVASKEGEVKESETVVELTFKVKEDATVGTTDIKIKDILTSADGDEEAATDQKATIEIVKKGSLGTEETQEPETKQDTGTKTTQEEKKTTSEVKTGEKAEVKSGTDTTVSKVEYPKTGALKTILPIFIGLIIAIGTAIGYKRYKKF